MSWTKLGALAATGAVLALLFHSLRRKKKKYHTNPFVQGVNRLKSHTILGSFESDIEARNNVSQIETSPFVCNLGGIWQFRLFNSVEEALTEVHRPSEPSLRDPIHVPGHWQLQGFSDHPIYTNIKYIIPVDPPYVPEMNPSGYYEREFVILESWANRKIVISFGGVDNAFYVWVNHVFIGFSKDSRVECEFDLTEVTKFGGASNLIQVVVLRFSDGSYLEDQDMWNFSGIFRDVHLISFPKAVHISDFSWNLVMDSFMHSCDVVVEVELKWDVYTLRRLFEDAAPNESCFLSRDSPYASSVESDWVLCCDLFEEGVLVSSSMQNGGSFILHDFTFDSSSDAAISSVAKYTPRPVGPGYQRSFSSWLDKSRNEKMLQNLPPDTTSLKLRLNVVSPGLWSAERPHVYTLVLSLRNARDNTIIQAESCRLGFRSVEISDGVLRVNQKPIMVRGVNYHEHDPVSGHSVSSQLLEADLKLMKRHNFNAVRTSHYPQTAMFYELCTLYGLFVVDEANIETHGMKPYAGRLADSLDWERAFTRRVVRMMRCHRNHTCIISWSLGNESGYGRTHDKLASLVRKHETNRVLMYEPASYGPRESSNSTGWFGLGGGSDRHIKKLATDVLCPMYPRVEDCIVIANRNPDLPVVLCEYAHMMGNSGGNLDVYWKWFNNFSRLQGGFIWDWADQGVSSIGLNGVPIWAYGGDFGESSHDGAFCLNGLNWPDRGLGDALTLSRHDCAEVRYARLFSRPSGAGLRKNKSDVEATFIANRPPSKVLSGSPLRRHFSPSQIDVVAGNNSPDPVEFERRRSINILDGADNVYELSPEDWSYLDHMKVNRHVYGLQRVMLDPGSTGSTQKFKTISRSSDRARSNRLASSFSIPVDDAIAKPQLLEAKQCMKVFDCEVTSLHPTEWDSRHTQSSTTNSSRGSSMNISQTASTASVISIGQGSHNEYPLSITIHYSILNRLNHIKNIEEYLQFDVLLLCDGIIVDRKPMVNRSRHGATNRRHVFDPTDGTAAYMQEVEMLCHFNVSLTSWKPSVTGVRSTDSNPVEHPFDPPKPKESDPEGARPPPALPLSRCTAASIPSATPSVLPAVQESPKLKGKRKMPADQQTIPVKSNVGWTAYGYVWPEDALLATDSFDHLPFKHQMWNVHCDEDGPMTRLRQESTGSNEWIRNPPTHERITMVHEHNATNKSKRNSFSMNGDAIPEVEQLEPSLWSDITPSTKWSTVVIGRLVPDTPWAEAGFPMGFVQCNISGKLIYSLLPSVPQVASKSQISSETLPPRAPTPGRAPRQSNKSPGLGLSEATKLQFEPNELPSNKQAASCEGDDNIGNFVSIDEETSLTAGELQKGGDVESGERRGRLRSRSGSWTDPGNSAVLSQIAAAGLALADRSCDHAQYCSSYNVSVLWVPRDRNIEVNSESFLYSMESPDILLRAEAPKMHPDDALQYPQTIEVTIDGSKGTIRSIVCNGNENLLLTEQELQQCGGSMHCCPSRFQLHRAPTDNDRMGYLPGWNAAGLDREMVQCINERFFGDRNDSQGQLSDIREDVVYNHPRDQLTTEEPQGVVATPAPMPFLNQSMRSKSIMEVSSTKASLFSTLDGLKSERSAIGSKFKSLEGTTELPYMTVVHVMVNSGPKSGAHPSPNMRASGPSVMELGMHEGASSSSNLSGAMKRPPAPEDVTEAFGVTCKWKMSPDAINSSRVAILRLLNSFAQDSMQQVVVVEVESNSSEIFLHEAAAKLQLGRQSQRPLIKKDIQRLDGTQVSILACRVRLWKPVLYMNSTTVKAEDLSRGPYGGLTLDEDDEDSARNTQDSDAVKLPAYSVYWEVTYSLSTKGELLVRASLDCRELPTVVPRVGMSLALRPTEATQTTMWRGLGPHENYPDRAASCVNAVHEAPTSALHTPYIRPSENGSRSGVYWMQLNDGKYKQKIQRRPRASFQDSQRSEGTNGLSDLTCAANETTKLALPIGVAKEGEMWDRVENEKTERMSHHESANNKGCAITVRSSKLFNFSLQEYSTEALSIASHSTALDSYTMQIPCHADGSALGTYSEEHTLSSHEKGNYGRGLSLNIDPFLMGVGGDDSWSACVHEEFTLPPSLYSFKVSLSFHYR